jgi:hypothetical protein
MINPKLNRIRKNPIEKYSSLFDTSAKGIEKNNITQKMNNKIQTVSIQFLPFLAKITTATIKNNTKMINGKLFQISNNVMIFLFKNVLPYCLYNINIIKINKQDFFKINIFEQTLRR